LESRKRRVMLATPAYDGRVEVAYANSLTQSLRTASGWELFPVWWPGEALVQHARNMLAMIALEAENPVDDIVFVDADQSWTPETLGQLLTPPVDVVGAPVRKKSDEEQYNVRALKLDCPPSGLWQVAGIGTGFLRVSRRALQAAWDMSPPYRKGDQESRMLFDVQISRDGQLIGEDMIFCEKLTTAGFPIYVDPSLSVGHIGTKNYTGNFAQWLDRIKQEHPAKP
jgi:hypothetical protein